MSSPDPWADDLRGTPVTGSAVPEATPDDDWRHPTAAAAETADDAAHGGADLTGWLPAASAAPSSPSGSADAEPTSPGIVVPVGPDGNDRDAATPGAAAPPASPGAPRRPAKRKRPVSRVVAEYGILAVFAIVLAFLIRTFVGLAFYIPSESMVPTLKVHDRVIVTRISYHLHDPRRGDIVVFDNPNFDEKKVSVPKRILRDALEVVGINQPKDKNLIKRIVGLPGETVQGKDGHVFVNGTQLPETYLPDGITTSDFGPVAIPKGRLWVMGDNRPNSADSRYFGTIERTSIVGRAFVRIWPPWRLGLL